MTIIYFIIVLSVTVFIHELGHFLFAKKAGIYVYEFSIGMGPRLFKFNRKNDETEYSIRLLPIGGFVQMAGESVEEDENIYNDSSPENDNDGEKSINEIIIYYACGVIILSLEQTVDDHAEACGYTDKPYRRNFLFKEFFNCTTDCDQ